MDLDCHTRIAKSPDVSPKDQIKLPVALLFVLEVADVQHAKEWEFLMQTEWILMSRQSPTSPFSIDPVSR